ncbi:MAG: hypothetical protein ACFE8O_00540 [Candidatus Hermodarchaeota archaeon]
MKFPNVSGKDLNGVKYNIPDKLEGKLNFLIIAFQRWQVRPIETWVPFLQTLEIEHPQIQFYELPTLRRFNILSQWIIDSGMRDGIRDKEMRARTITLYIDKSEFTKALDIPTEDTIYLFLVDCDGNILWRDTGEFSEQKEKAVLNAITEFGA